MDEAEAMAADDTARAKQDGLMAASEAIPQADEPLKPSVINTAWQLVGPAIEAMTEGQLEAEPYMDVTEPADRVPPELGQKILAIGSLIRDVPDLSAYAFDPIAALRTNAGLTEASALIDDMSRDKKALKALKAPMPAAEPEETEETEAPAMEPAEEE